MFHLIFLFRTDRVMEGDKSNDNDNPPASSSIVQENDEFSFINMNNDASDSTGIFINGSPARVDPLSFPHMPSPILPFPWKVMHGTYQPYTHSIPDTRGSMMIDLNQLFNQQNTPVTPYRQDVPFTEGNVKQVSHTHNKSGVADASMIDSPFSNCFKISEINRNYSLILGNADGGNEMTGHGVEADGSYGSGPPLKNFVGVGGSETFNSQNCEVLNIDNRDHASQFGCPKNTYGSFLSLGIGDQTDARFKSDLSRGEIPGELEGAVFPQSNASHVRQATGSSLSPSQNLFSAFPSFQNNVGGFTGWGNDAGGWVSNNTNGGAISGTNTSLESRPFPFSQNPQADLQHGFPKSSGRNLGFVDNRVSRYVHSDPYKAFVGGVTTPSGPISSSSARLCQSGQIGASGFATESVNVTGATTQPISDQLQRRFIKTVQTLSPESSMVSSFGGVKGSSVRQEHSGESMETNHFKSPSIYEHLGTLLILPELKFLWLSDYPCLRCNNYF